MKTRLLFTAIALFVSSTLQAQSFIAQNGDNPEENWDPHGGPVAVYNNIKNTISTDIYLKWRIIDKSIQNGWLFESFCDNGNCYTDSNALLAGSIRYSSAYTPGIFMDFHAVFNGDNAALNSSSWVRVRADDTVNNYTKTYTFTAKKGNVGVTTTVTQSSDIVVYPNPARNVLNVSYNSYDNIRSIAIYNLIGKVVTSYKVTGGSAQLNISNIPSGVYYIRLQNADGIALATRRFTRQ